jgi:hypothetical protein
VTENNYVNSTNFHPEGEVALQAFSTLQGKLPPLKATPEFEYKDLLRFCQPKSASGQSSCRSGDAQLSSGI